MCFPKIVDVSCSRDLRWWDDGTHAKEVLICNCWSSLEPQSQRHQEPALGKGAERRPLLQTDIPEVRGEI